MPVVLIFNTDVPALTVVVPVELSVYPVVDIVLEPKFRVFADAPVS